MARDKEIICKYYTYAGGPCDKRGISVHFKAECQTCKYYDPVKNGKPARINDKQGKLRKIKDKEFKRGDY